jgi:hypothetical protein
MNNQKDLELRFSGKIKKRVDSLLKHKIKFQISNFAFK